MNPDRFPLIFRSVQFWLGEAGVPAAEKPTFVSGEIELDGIELWAAVRVLLSMANRNGCLFYFVHVEF